MQVGDFIRLHAVNIGHETALVCGDRRLSYAEVNREINRAAHALILAGVRQGDRVAALGRNSLPYFCLYFATAKIGAILVPLNFWHRAEEHKYVLTDAAPVMAFIDAEFTAVVDEALAGASPLPMVALTGALANGKAWDAFIAGQAEGEPAVAPAYDWPHMILYTSGTTGRPKGAVLTHGRTVQDAFGMASALRVRQTDTFINFFPSFHVGNWDHQKLFLLLGATIVLMPQFDAELVLKAIARERVTVLLGVPTMLHALLTHPTFAGTDCSSIRLVYYGAYDPSGILARTADTFGAREGKVEMAHTYGLTEAGPFVTLCPPEQVFRHWGSIGRAVPGVEVALLDDDGQPVPAGSPGEICVRGPRMVGYWNKPEASAAALAGGWLHTGDIGVTDAEGFLSIVDRKKDMIRSGGQNVFSKEVEDCLSGHPAVADVAIIGLDDPVYEELVCAVVVLRPGAVPGEALKADLAAYLRGRIAGYNTPKVITFIDALPKNAVGKIQKHILREQYRRLPPK